MIDALQGFVESLPLWLQWGGVMLAGAIPFVESELSSVIGIAAGIAPPVAIAAGVLGNVLVVWLLVTTTHTIRGRAMGSPSAPASGRRQKVQRAFDKYGVAGVSLLGPFILPSQITSVAMISFGAAKGAVLIWQAIAITLWGCIFGVLATFGIDLLGQ